MIGPKFAASVAELTSVGLLTNGATAGALTAQLGAVPTSPTTDDFTTVIGTGPIVLSITSTPCRNDALIVFSPSLTVAPRG